MRSAESLSRQTHSDTEATEGSGTSIVTLSGGQPSSLSTTALSCVAGDAELPPAAGRPRAAGGVARGCRGGRDGGGGVRWRSGVAKEGASLARGEGCSPAELPRGLEGAAAPAGAGAGAARGGSCRDDLGVPPPVLPAGAVS
eukprot:TRINITY_DN9932_c0_g2_i1.p2 TRINITY_DN9932_c0_g2~~TRINITY_DN9932_c0_g2_i1.p2  ORF type:complete len:142 (-),score=15.02 TRINITY_DN9932_c0_g2_i1:185-610(-)